MTFLTNTSEAFTSAIGKSDVVRGTADFRPQRHTGVAATASRSREVLRHLVGKHACPAKAGGRPTDQKDAFGTASSGMAR